MVRGYPHPSRPALGPNPTSCTIGTGSLGRKTAGAWRLPPTPSCAEVKESVELYLSPPGSSRSVLRRTIPFLYRYVLPNALCSCQLNSGPSAGVCERRADSSVCVEVCGLLISYVNCQVLGKTLCRLVAPWFSRSKRPGVP